MAFSPALEAQSFSGKGPHDFELEETGLSELATGLRQGKWTCSRLAELYLARIERIDRSGPRLNSVIALNPGAMAISRQLDQELKANRPRGPLHGIPILIKDNIETSDPISTTAGSLALEGWRAPKDAFLVARLRAAGR